MAKPTERVVRRNKKRVSEAKAVVNALKNNTTVTITDMEGNVLSQSSAGQFRKESGNEKKSSYAARLAAERAGRQAKEMNGVETVKLILKGFGKGRSAVGSVLQSLGLRVLAYIDKTPTAHNGCRPKKARRV